jgi:hypothetical protein
VYLDSFNSGCDHVARVDRSDRLLHMGEHAWSVARKSANTLDPQGGKFQMNLLEPKAIPASRCRLMIIQAG